MVEVTDVGRLAAQAQTMADARRLEVLALALLDPSGQPTAAWLAADSVEEVEIAGHLRAMADVGILEQVGDGYRATPDALARFGGTALELFATSGPREVVSFEPPGREAHPAVLRRIARDLVPRFSGRLSAETVERFVMESYHLLARRSAVSLHLPTLTARFAADRLAALCQPVVVASPGGSVLFVCVRNAGRSQIAAAIARARRPALRVRCAGSAPAARVDPGVQAELDRRGLGGYTEFPRPLTPEVVRAAGTVISMGCGDACPVIPGREYLDWPIPDPAGRPRHEISQIVDEIETRVTGLLRDLEPIDR